MDLSAEVIEVLTLHARLVAETLAGQHAQRAEAYSAVFHATGRLCTPKVDPKHFIMSRDEFEKFSTKFSNVYDAHGCWLDGLSRSWSWRFREALGAWMRLNPGDAFDLERKSRPDDPPIESTAGFVWMTKTALRIALTTGIQRPITKAPKDGETAYMPPSRLLDKAMREEVARNYALILRMRDISQAGSIAPPPTGDRGRTKFQELVDRDVNAFLDHWGMTKKPSSLGD